MAWRDWINRVEEALDAECIGLSAADLTGIPLAVLFADGTGPEVAAGLVLRAWSEEQARPLVACVQM